MSAVISECGLYRYRLDRRQRNPGPVVAFFGVNPSTADADAEDATTRKWHGFCAMYGFGRYIVGNLFAFRSTDVSKLAQCSDAVGPLNRRYLQEIATEADILIPCWGNSSKVPKPCRHVIGSVLADLRATGKPLKTFGFTNSGDPKHPLMLAYSTPLIDYPATPEASP